MILDWRERPFPPCSEHPLTLPAMYTLGKVMKDEERLEEAENMLGKARETASRVLLPRDPRTVLCAYALAEVAMLGKRRQEALSLLQDALDHGLDPPTTQAIGKERISDRCPMTRVFTKSWPRVIVSRRQSQLSTRLFYQG